MTAKVRAKDRLERQKMLICLPKSKLEQNYMAFRATLNGELLESLEDLLLIRSTSLVAVFRIRNVFVRIRIRGSIPIITDPDPAPDPPLYHWIL
jgi:hypothetical protein